MNDYNENTRLIDKSDMQITSVDCLRKTKNWTRKLAFHLTDMCMLNAYNMYTVKTGEKSSLRAFSKLVVTQLLERFGKPRSIESRPGRRRDEARRNISRLKFAEAFALHIPIHVPPPPRRAGRKGQRECVVCKDTTMRERKRKRVTTTSKECNVGLCLGDCFQAHHTLLSF